MKNARVRLASFLPLLAILLSSCGPRSTVTEKIPPSRLEPIEGSDLQRVVLTEAAAERLDIHTALVRDEQVGRTQVVNGEVVASPARTAVVTAPSSGILLPPSDAILPVAGAQLSAGQTIFRLSATIDPRDSPSLVNLQVPGDSVLIRLLATPGQFVEAGQSLFEFAELSEVWVRVLVRASELDRLDRSQAVRVLLSRDDAEEIGLAGEEAEGPDDDELEDDDEAGDVDVALYYGLDNAGHTLSLRQRVRVELTLAGSGAPRRVIPYAAVIYDTDGRTWVYTNPEPLVFVRQLIVIDYIEADLAVLSEGPESGTAVVTVGAAELFGAETGVSK